MAESKPEQPRRGSRDLILEALAGHVVEHGNLAFSVAAIAQRAGLSHRTVYNHFATRQALVEALSEWAEQRGEARGEVHLPPDIASLPELVRANFLLFEQDAEINEAYARVDTTVTAVPKLGQRNRAVEAEVARAYPDLNRRQCLAVTGALRLNASIRTWYVLTRELGLSAEEAADTASWTLTCLIASLDRGDTPI